MIIRGYNVLATCFVICTDRPDLLEQVIIVGQHMMTADDGESTVDERGALHGEKSARRADLWQKSSSSSSRVYRLTQRNADKMSSPAAGQACHHNKWAEGNCKDCWLGMRMGGRQLVANGQQMMTGGPCGQQLMTSGPVDDDSWASSTPRRFMRRRKARSSVDGSSWELRVNCWLTPKPLSSTMSALSSKLRSSSGSSSGSRKPGCTPGTL